MLGKTARPVIEIFTGSLVSGHWSGQVEATASPRSQSQSPRGRKSFDFGGVGLGIVAALEKSGGCGNQSPANNALFGRNLSRSNPIPVSSPKNPSRNRRCSEEVSVKTESMEEYTIVTCHGPNKSYTKVYSDAGEGGRKGYQNTPYRIQGSLKSKGTSFFSISPARHGEATRIPASDFLSSCNLCHKKLHGKDIYMYRGEKAFCSTECRYRQMVMDERTENCSSEASRPVDVAGSPYGNGQIFTTGILAT